jgi:hypothetical protein
VFNSRTNSLGNRSIFPFYLLLFAFIKISVFSCRAIDMGLVTFCYVCISDGAERLPPLLPHRGWQAAFQGPALPGVSESAIRHTHPSWLRRGRSSLPLPIMSMAHVLDRCEVGMTIPFDSTVPWLGSVIDSEPDTNVQMMVHITLTSLCEDLLAATAALPIALLPIWNPENPVW